MSPLKHDSLGRKLVEIRRRHCVVTIRRNLHAHIFHVDEQNVGAILGGCGFGICEKNEQYEEAIHGMA